MQSSNGYFQHDPAVITFAWLLVNEYIRHEKEQDRLQRKVDPFVRIKPKKLWKQGGMVKNDT